MIDTYTMVLWARANENDLDMQAQQIFDILTPLDKIDYLKPRYITVRRKKDVKDFILTYENVKHLISDKKDKQFPDLGSSISFFTSLNDNDSVGISMTIGVSELNFQNTIVINLNTDIKKKNNINYDELVNLFKILVKVFNPFYGCMTCKSNRNMFGGYFDNNKKIPKSIFDLNYWDLDIVNKINPIDNYSNKLYEFEKINNGYYIRLQRELIDVSDASHIELQEKINGLVGLS